MKVYDEDVVERAIANEFDNFALAIRRTVQDKMIDRMEDNQAIVSKYVNEDDFQQVVFEQMARRMYEEIRAAEQ